MHTMKSLNSDKSFIGLYFGFWALLCQLIRVGSALYENFCNRNKMDFKLRKGRRRVRGRQGLVWHPQISYTSAYFYCFKLLLKLLGSRGEIYFSLFFFFKQSKQRLSVTLATFSALYLKWLSYLIFYKHISSSLFFLLHSSLLINCSLCNIEGNENTWHKLLQATDHDSLILHFPVKKHFVWIMCIVFVLPSIRVTR